MGTNILTRVATVWHRSKTQPSRLLGNLPPETRTAHESTHHLPHEIVEMIIAHLTHDLGGLEACSLTCRSWYIAAVPHLHHTLTLLGGGPDVDRSRLKPLSRLYELGLLPLVKEIRVERSAGTCCWFLPLTFSHVDLHNFSALANVHTLKIQDMEIHHFIENMELHFGHFSQTLRSITLHNPCCTPRQLSHFLSLFSNMDDVRIRNTRIHASNTYISNGTAPDTELIQFSAPKLRGQLALYRSPGVETWAHLASCGGLRFRHMDLRGSTDCAPVLFKACAETLETLRFDTALSHRTDDTLSKQFRVSSSMDFV